MSRYRLSVFNETALPNNDFAAGLQTVEQHLARVLAPEHIAADVVLQPKHGRIPKDLMAKRPAGTRLLCLVDDGSRALSLCKDFHIPITDIQRAQALRPTAHGLAPIRRPALFLWAFEVNGVKRYNTSFGTRLRGSCLHELGHSHGLVHEKDAKGTPRDQDLDLMIARPRDDDPKAHYLPVDATYIAERMSIFVKHDKGGYHYPAA